MKVLLINPPPERRVDQYDLPDFTRLGLACLAGELPARTSLRVAIIDAKFERLDDAAVLERVRAFGPDLVGITAMTTEVIAAGRIAAGVKAVSSRIITVIGGVHVSVLPEQTLDEFPSFDLGVIGEGEESFRELCEACSAEGASSPALQSIRGLVLRGSEGPFRSPPRPRVVALDRLADPAWELLPPSPRYLVSTQRGCPYDCDFCANPNGRRVRARSVARVVAEMRALVEERGAERFYICDEIFTQGRSRSLQLLDAMRDAGLGERVRWSAATHVGHVDRLLMEKMKTAGCELCELGVETGDEDTMARIGKGLDRQALLVARETAAEVGLPFGALMILGHPGETWASAWRSIELAVALNADQTIFGIMVPYPGTRVARMAARGEGGYRLIARDWNDYGKQHGHAVEMEGLSRAKLEALQIFGYVAVLLGNHRYRDLARFSWRFRREGMAILAKRTRSLFFS